MQTNLGFIIEQLTREQSNHKQFNNWRSASSFPFLVVVHILKGHYGYFKSFGIISKKLLNHNVLTRIYSSQQCTFHGLANSNEPHLTKQGYRTDKGEFFRYTDIISSCLALSEGFERDPSSASPCSWNGEDYNIGLCHLQHQDTRIHHPWGKVF